MATIHKFVTTGLLALVAAVAFALPASADAAQRAGAKKKAHATASSRASRQALLRSGRRVSSRHLATVVRFEPARPSFGHPKKGHHDDDRPGNEQHFVPAALMGEDHRGERHGWNVTDCTASIGFAPIERAPCVARLKK